MEENQTGTKGERTREQILLRTGKLFEQKGFYKTGIEDIARELKMARGTLYQYFRSKEDLLQTLLLWSEERLLGELKSLSGVGCSDPETFFGEIIKVFLMHSRQYGDLFGIYFSVSSELTVGFREKDLPPFTRIIAIVEDLLLESGAGFNSSLKCFELGTMAFMIIESIRMSQGLMKDSDEIPTDLICRRAEMFFRGVLKQ